MKKQIFILLITLGMLPLNAQVDSTKLSNLAKEEIPPPPPPLPLRRPSPKMKRVFEERSKFPGCEDFSGTDKEKEACSNKKMVAFFLENIQYPAIAKRRGIEGSCIISFVVEKNGEVSNIEIVQDIGGGCGKEAARVVHLMNEKGLRWTPPPARRYIKPRPLLVKIPITFKLEDEQLN